MRKARQRAIRRAFRAAVGRSPRPTQWRARFGAWVPSEWRRVKKAVIRARRAGLPAGAAIAAAVGR